MESKYSYELRLGKKPPHDLLIVHEDEITTLRLLPGLESIDLLIEAINSLNWEGRNCQSDVEEFEDAEWVVWGCDHVMGHVGEAFGDVCFALGGSSWISYFYEPPLNCDEGSDTFQRAEAKIRWMKWQIVPDAPPDDDDDDERERDCRYDVAKLLVFRGDCHMSQGCHGLATKDYRKALEIYPDPDDLGLFQRPASQPETGLTFLQLLRKPAIYQDEIRRHLRNVQGNELTEHVATLKAVSRAWAEAQFSEQANALERVWKDLFKEQVKTTGDLLVKALTLPTRTLGLDLDGTIDEDTHFFSVLSQMWPGKVYVVTFRDDRAKAVAVLDRLGIRYDDVILVNSFAEKAEVIGRLGIDVYFDDQDEALLHVGEGVTVFKMRNGGNYDHQEKKWLYSKITGRPV
jgi:hypothetical protein